MRGGGGTENVRVLCVCVCVCVSEEGGLGLGGWAAMRTRPRGLANIGRIAGVHLGHHCANAVGMQFQERVGFESAFFKHPAYWNRSGSVPDLSMTRTQRHTCAVLVH